VTKETAVFYLAFVFALAERKNEIQIDREYYAAAGYRSFGKRKQFEAQRWIPVL
jgi:hypothetical protein